MEFAKFFTDMQSLFTLISFLTFMGILVWTFSSKRSRDFAEAAQLPFADEAQEQAGGRHG